MRQFTGDRLGIFGGLGGVILLDELRRGSIGAMTGFAYPEVLVEVIDLFFDGQRQKATEVFNKFLPLILFENQEGINLSIRKEAIKGRGLISTAKVRHPAGPIDDDTRGELFQLIEDLKPAERKAAPIRG
ncbi:MAG: dihydrodipicolinate synthase family protein [Chloroflexi bacterium]|nr:dihydrodipicolinate synthase family protein [Chloroflexota bacterium]